MNKTLNFETNKSEWHEFFNQFCQEIDVDIHHQHPFFWWLRDHHVIDIDWNILSAQWDAFKAQTTDILYQG